jgi:GNAT superfamily N-acetyltransferase
VITERIDPLDPAAFDQWHAVMAAATAEGREYPAVWSLEEMRIALTRESPYSASEIWVVRTDAGQIAGFLHLHLPLLDNTSLVSADLGVPAEHRRQGYGSALGRLVEERMAHHGREIVHGMVHNPLDGAAPGRAFALAHGMKVGIVDMHRVLQLPVEDGLLESLVSEVADHHRDYRLVSWRDRCPDDLVDAYAVLEGTFLSEAPMGDLEMENEAYDADRIRFREDQAIAQGRQSWVTVAIAPDGALVGQTELFVPSHDPVNAFQSGTLVAPAHRGHRLGLALKARNHLEVQRTETGRRVLHTWNAEQNTAMNAVNERLGFRPVELTEEWQRRI